MTYRHFHWLALKMDAWMMMHVCKLETSPKNIAQNKVFLLISKDYTLFNILQLYP